MSNLETEVRALIEAVEKLSEHQMDDAMFKQWRDGVLPAVERVRGALDGGGEAVYAFDKWWDIHADDNFKGSSKALSRAAYKAGFNAGYTRPSASVPEGYVLVEKGFTPIHVVEAGVGCLKALMRAHVIDTPTVAAAVFQDMLLACEKEGE